MKIYFDKYGLLKVLLAIILFVCVLSGCANMPIICTNKADGNLGSGINSPFNDYAAVSINDHGDLIFTSSRTKGDDENECLYMAKKAFRNYDVTDVLLENSVKGYNQGSAAFSGNRKKIILSRAHLLGGYGGTDLYIADFVKEEVCNIKNLGPTVNSTYWEAQPCISSDGGLLIFSSDRPGGFGGADLWQTELLPDGKWSAPVNMGPGINTKGDELSPYYYDHKDTILFFSSNGRQDTKGKLDIYYAYKKENGFDEPVCIQPNINSYFNEMFPYPENDLKNLMFSSDRNDGCGGYDIYRMPVEIVPKYIKFEAVVIDSVTNEPLKIPANIKVINTVDGQITECSTSIPGSNYSVEHLRTGKYRIEIQAQNYFFRTLEYDLKASTGEMVQKLNPIPIQKVPIKVFDLKEYNVPFFVSGYYRLNVPENLKEVNFLLSTVLKDAKYVEKPSKKYEKYSKFVEKLFRDTVFTVVVDSILPQYENDKKKYLEIEISGFADPRPIHGKYIEDDVSFGDLKITTQQEMDNDVLSALRAIYTKEYTDKELMKNEIYKKMRNEGRIKFIAEGKGVDIIQKNKNRESDYDARRRIKIKIWQKYFDR